MRAHRWLAGASLLVVFGCGPAERNGAETKPPALDPARGAFELNAVHHFNGKVARLADVKGKVVLIDFWAVWCGPCLMAFPHLSDLHKQYHDDGLEILGVTTYFAQDLSPDEEAQALEQFVAKHKLPYPILVISRDDWRKAMNDYGVKGFPTLVLLDRQGDMQGRWEGFSPEGMRVVAETIPKVLAEK